MYIIRSVTLPRQCAMRHESKQLGTKAIFEDVRWLPIAMTAMADVWGPGVRPSGDTLTTTHYREPHGSSLITLVRHARGITISTKCGDPVKLFV